MKFSEFALRAEILQAVDEAGYQIPTPIQAAAIPAILTGVDVLGIAQTGTGKTAAFVLPMIERLALGQAKARMPRSLILSPTRELATQTAAYFETYGKHLKLNMALLIGGVGMDEQWRRLERGVDVLIATPGRLIDQFERGKVLLGGVTILVIDEADRMLDMGFIPDVEKIVTLISRRRQTLLFSATMPAEVRRLADNFLNEPIVVQASPPATTVDRIADHLTIVPPRQKFKVLRRLIESQEVGKAIIFCNRKREVSVLRRQLEKAGMNARDIHGDLDQSQRTDALDAFKRGDIDFLVATDVAARGLDIAMLPCVINYDIPTHADDYVHRIGRTGRAGQEGRAFTLVLPEEGRFIDAITKLTGKEIPRLIIPGTDDAELEAPLARGRGRGRGGRTSEAPAAREAPAERAGPAERAAPAGREATSSRRGKAKRPSPAPAPVESPIELAEPEAEVAEPMAAPERSLAPQERTAPPHERGRRRGARALEQDEPVVGMGEHVPMFMRRPVPVLRKAGDA